MRRTLLAVLSVLVALVVVVPAASAAEADNLRRASPSWLTESLKQRIHAAGPGGVQVPEEYLNTECPGFQARGVSANGCIVAPYGCTANFIFSDGRDWRTYPYVGTASHCTDRKREPVIMQVNTTTLAEVGMVYRQTAGEEPGDDFALIEVYPEVAARWGVNPGIPTGGPQGIYGGCDPQVVTYYGHGYGVAVGQGKPEGGLANTWYSDGYGWYGAGLPGDSGSGVTIQDTLSDGRDNLSAGNFTHIVIYDPAGFYTPGQLTGMRTTAILEFLGSGFSQVNADGSTSTSGPAACESSVGGGSSEGGSPGGKGQGGGKDKPDDRKGGPEKS